MATQTVTGKHLPMQIRLHSIPFSIHHRWVFFWKRLTLSSRIYLKVTRALTLKMKGHEATNLAQVENASFSERKREREREREKERKIMGCGQNTSEELDTSHSSLKTHKSGSPSTLRLLFGSGSLSLFFFFIALSHPTAQPIIQACIPAPWFCMRRSAVCEVVRSLSVSWRSVVPPFVSDLMLLSLVFQGMGWHFFF